MFIFREGEKFRELKRWIKQNRPDIDARLFMCDLPSVRVLLNEITGILISPSDSIEAGAHRYLAALKSL